MSTQNIWLQIYNPKSSKRILALHNQLANLANRAGKGIAIMDVIPVEQMNTAMLTRLVKMVSTLWIG